MWMDVCVWGGGRVGGGEWGGVYVCMHTHVCRQVNEQKTTTKKGIIHADTFKVNLTFSFSFFIHIK